MTPWQDPHSPWRSQSAYFAWLRGGLRRLWTRNPVSTGYKNAMCRKAVPEDGFSKRVKSIGLCERCKEWHAKSSLEVDHIEPAGSLQSWEDVEGFVRRLLGCSSESLRLVCKPCHATITHAERFQCTEEEAVIQKRVIAFAKLSVHDQKAELYHINPNMDIGRNAKERRAIYQKHLSNAPL